MTVNDQNKDITCEHGLVCSWAQWRIINTFEAVDAIREEAEKRPTPPEDREGILRTNLIMDVHADYISAILALLRRQGENCVNKTMLDWAESLHEYALEHAKDEYERPH